MKSKSLNKQILNKYDLDEVISKNEDGIIIIIHIYETFTLNGDRVWTVQSVNKHINIFDSPDHTWICNTVITSDIINKFESEILNKEKYKDIQWNNTFTLAIASNEIVAELAECIRKDFNNETFN